MKLPGTGQVWLVVRKEQSRCLEVEMISEQTHGHSQQASGVRMDGQSPLVTGTVPTSKAQSMASNMSSLCGSLAEDPGSQHPTLTS